MSAPGTKCLKNDRCPTDRPLRPVWSTPSTRQSLPVTNRSPHHRGHRVSVPKAQSFVTPNYCAYLTEQPYGRVTVCETLLPVIELSSATFT